MANSCKGSIFKMAFDKILTKIKGLTSEMDSTYLKTHTNRLINHFKVSGWKVNFPDGFWWPTLIYADYESCPYLPDWQQS